MHISDDNNVFMHISDDNNVMVIYVSLSLCVFLLNVFVLPTKSNRNIVQNLLFICTIRPNFPFVSFQCSYSCGVDVLMII